MDYILFVNTILLPFVPHKPAINNAAMSMNGPVIFNLMPTRQTRHRADEFAETSGTHTDAEDYSTEDTTG
jgi:hypothetical protein